MRILFFFTLSLFGLILLYTNSGFAKGKLHAGKKVEIFVKGKKYESLKLYKTDRSEQLLKKKEEEQEAKAQEALGEKDKKRFLELKEKIGEKLKKDDSNIEDDLQVFEAMLRDFERKNKSGSPILIDPKKMKTIVISPQKQTTLPENP